MRLLALPAELYPQDDRKPLISSNFRLFTFNAVSKTLDELPAFSANQYFKYFM